MSSMLLRRIWVKSRRILRRSRLAQIVVIVALWWLGDQAVQAMAIDLPGGVIGMFALLALLATGWVRSRTLGKGADWLLAEMLLFFVPAVVVVIDMPELIGVLGIKLLLAVIVGTSLVMMATAASVWLGRRWIDRDER